MTGSLGIFVCNLTVCIQVLRELSFPNTVNSMCGRIPERITAERRGYMPIEKEYITPDKIRDKELENLRQKLSTAKRLGWLLFVLGLALGTLISWSLSGIC